MKSVNKEQDQAHSAIEGLKKYCHKQTIVVDGAVVHVNEMIKELESYASLLDEVATARKAWRRLIQQEKTATAGIKPTLTALRGFVANQFGANSEALTEFGFQPRKVGRRTVASKAKAIEKERATRAAHHTPVVNGANGASNGAPHA